LKIDIRKLNSTIEGAKYLLGKEIVFENNGVLVGGIIVETEAYLQDDPACHAYRGVTQRTMPMFSEPGTIYVYLIYGMYLCLNIVTNRVGVGEAVLIRAIKPTINIEKMQENRKTKKITNIASGPGKLCIALGIGKEINNTPLFEKLSIKDVGNKYGNIVEATRIGIKEAADLNLRFYLEEEKKFVSSL